MTAKFLKEECGVTLLELAIAAGIFAMVIVFLMGGLIEVNQTNLITENQTVVSSQLESVVEEIQSLTYDQLLQYQPPDLPGLGVDSAIIVNAFRVGGGTVTLPVSDTFTGTLPNPVPIQVRAVWIDLQGRANTANVTTFHRR
jgi:Flp pilus assembly pilin Flp